MIFLHLPGILNDEKHCPIAKVSAISIIILTKSLIIIEHLSFFCFPLETVNLYSASFCALLLFHRGTEAFSRASYRQWQSFSGKCFVYFRVHIVWVSKYPFIDLPVKFKRRTASIWPGTLKHSRLTLPEHKDA